MFAPSFCFLCLSLLTALVLQPVLTGHETSTECLGHRCEVSADLPTCLYLTVFVQKLAHSTDVRAYLSEYRQRVSRKCGNLKVNECQFVASEVDY